jgi:hypothetical protein
MAYPTTPEQETTMSDQAGDTCGTCGVKRENCRPGGRYYDQCPFKAQGQGHDWKAQVMTDPKLWLPAAIYRIIADTSPGETYRSDLYFVFTEHSALVDPIVDALLEYGAITRHDGLDGEYLRPAPDVDDAIPPRHLLVD